MWLVKFSRNFRRDLAAGDLDIYLEGLNDLSAAFLNSACEACLKTCMFMPTVAEIRTAYDKVVFDSTHYDRKASSNPASNCQHCKGAWVVMKTKFINMAPDDQNHEYHFAVECPAVEQHRSDWQATHPGWSYVPSKLTAPKLSEIGN